MTDRICTKVGAYPEAKHPVRKVTGKGNVRLTVHPVDDTLQRLTIKQDGRIVLDLSSDMAKGLLTICQLYAANSHSRQLGTVGVLLANALLDPTKFTKETI